MCNLYCYILYADDVTLLATSVSALQVLVGICAADVMQQLTACLEINLNKHSPTTILGDFNRPDIEMQTLSCSTDLLRRATHSHMLRRQEHRCSQPGSMVMGSCNVLLNLL